MFENSKWDWKIGTQHGVFCRCNGYNECPPLPLQNYLSKEGFRDGYCKIPSDFDPTSCLDVSASYGKHRKGQFRNVNIASLQKSKIHLPYTIPIRSICCKTISTRRDYWSTLDQRNFRLWCRGIGFWSWFQISPKLSSSMVYISSISSSKNYHSPSRVPGFAYCKHPGSQESHRQAPDLWCPIPKSKVGCKLNECKPNSVEEMKEGLEWGACTRKANYRHTCCPFYRSRWRDVKDMFLAIPKKPLLYCSTIFIESPWKKRLTVKYCVWTLRVSQLTQ